MLTTYYVAASLDGFIATPDGKVDWLDCVGESGHSSYAKFFDSIDGLVMGRNSYDFVCNSGHAWPYGDKPCWVLTNREIETGGQSAMSTSVIPTQLKPTQIIEEAKTKGLEHLWVVGGGKTAAAFLKEGLLDSMIVSVIPILLSEGIPLFAGSFEHQLLKWHSTKSFDNGLVEITYDLTDKRKAKAASPKITEISGGSFERGVFAGEELLDLLDEIGGGVRDTPKVDPDELKAALQEIWPARKKVRKKKKKKVVEDISAKEPTTVNKETSALDSSKEVAEESIVKKPEPSPELFGFLSTVMREDDYDGEIAVFYGLKNLVKYQKTEGPICDVTDERKIIQFGFWTGDFGDGDAWCYDIRDHLIRCVPISTASDLCDEMREGSYGVHDNFLYFVAHLRCSARMRGWID